MLIGLVKFLKMTIVLAAAILYLPFLSPYLPFGADLHAAACWLGLSGTAGETAPVWGWLLQFSGLFTSRVALRFGVVSFACAILSALFYGSTVYCLLRSARREAERTAQRREADYEFAARFGTLLAVLVFLLIPAFFFAATHASARMTQFALPLAALALVVQLPRVVQSHRAGYLVTVIGFLSGLGALESGPGLLFLPVAPALLLSEKLRGPLNLVLALVLFVMGAVGGLVFVSGSWETFLRLFNGLTATLPGSLFFDGVLPFVLLSVFPALALSVLMTTHRLAQAKPRRMFFGVWGLAVVALAMMTFGSNPRDRGKAADVLVGHALTELGQRKLLVSDGTFDDIILFRKPAWVRLVDVRQYAAESPAENVELGPATFLCEDRPVHPEWTAEAQTEKLNRDWNEARPLLRSDAEPGAKELRRWFAARGRTLEGGTRRDAK